MKPTLVFKELNYSEALICIVFPLGSSNLSIVLISIIIDSPMAMIVTRMAVTKMPDQIGAVVNPMQYRGSPNAVIADVDACS